MRWCTSCRTPQPPRPACGCGTWWVSASAGFKPSRFPGTECPSFPAKALPKHCPSLLSLRARYLCIPEALPKHCSSLLSLRARYLCIASAQRILVSSPGWPVSVASPRCIGASCSAADAGTWPELPSMPCTSLVDEKMESWYHRTCQHDDGQRIEHFRCKTQKSTKTILN